MRSRGASSEMRWGHAVARCCHATVLRHEEKEGEKEGLRWRQQGSSNSEGEEGGSKIKFPVRLTVTGNLG